MRESHRQSFVVGLLSMVFALFSVLALSGTAWAATDYFFTVDGSESADTLVMVTDVTQGKATWDPKTR